jgi:hypothetical protein
VTRPDLTDQDIAAAMERSRRADARRIAAYAERMAKYRETMKQGGGR